MTATIAILKYAHRRQLFQRSFRNQLFPGALRQARIQCKGCAAGYLRLGSAVQLPGEDELQHDPLELRRVCDPLPGRRLAPRHALRRGGPRVGRGAGGPDLEKGTQGVVETEQGE